MFSAWIDESGSDSRRDPGTYILAAAVCASDDLSAIRSSMSGLLLPGQRKLHWRDERDSRRRAIADTLAGLPLEHLVVIRCDSSQHPERRRRLCLRRLLVELSALGATSVTAESRGPKDDRRDLEILGHLRATHTIDSTLRLTHAPGPTEPALWVPDACCGIVSARRIGVETYWNTIADSVTLFDAQ